ncbi:MAG: DUF4112 domain-containing protein [Pseudomonadota bacterium]
MVKIDTDPPIIDDNDGTLPDHDHEDIRRLARLLDNQFRIPGTGIQFGLDALIGLVPVVGDVVGGVISIYLVGKAMTHGAPMSLVVRMLVNTGIDFAAGSVPVVGDLFDVAWQANRKNVELLDGHLRKRAVVERAARARTVNPRHG